MSLKDHNINSAFLVLQVLNSLLPRFLKKAIKREKNSFINMEEFKNLKSKTPFIDYGERDSDITNFSISHKFTIIITLCR